MGMIVNDEWKLRALEVVKSQIIQRIDEGEGEIIDAINSHIRQRMVSGDPLAFSLSFSAKIDPSFYPRVIRVETGASWTVKGSKKEAVDLNLEPSFLDDDGNVTIETREVTE